jgi:hypothetical protein
MKNTVYAIVIVVCFVGASVLAYKYIFTSGSGGGIDDIPEGRMTWVKCNNPNCKAEYQMGLKAYHKYMEEHATNPMAPAPPLICKECGKPSVYRAEKCENPDCGIVFIEGSSGPGDHADRCPKCKQSATEESRKRRKAEREAGQ